MVLPPSECPNGHHLGPGRMLVRHQPYAGYCHGRHTTWECLHCSAIRYHPPTGVGCPCWMLRRLNGDGMRRGNPLAHFGHWVAGVAGHVVHWFAHLTELSVAIFAAVVATVAALLTLGAFMTSILARRARSDGYIPDCVCRADLNSYVLGDASGSDPINRSKLLWTVTFEQPGFQTQVRSVSNAWFAGN